MNRETSAITWETAGGERGAQRLRGVMPCTIQVLVSLASMRAGAGGHRTSHPDVRSPLPHSACARARGAAAAAS